MRILPPRIRAVFPTLLAAALLYFFSRFIFGSSAIDWHKAYGDRLPVVLFAFSILIMLLLVYLVWYARRLLPGSPLDLLEVGPDGLAFGGWFGRRERRWNEITGFSVGAIPLRHAPILWIKVESQRPLRFMIGHYLHFRLFSSQRRRVQEIADWLDHARRTYAYDDRLPTPPDGFGGKVVILTEEEAA